METYQEDDETQSAPSDWKNKKGFDFQERMTLKINQQEAERYKSRDKKRDLKNKSMRPESLNAGLRKLRKKIRDAFDDEDDEDEGFIFIPVLQMEEDDNKLLNGLNEDEKRMFKQKETIEHVQMQQTAGKMEAIQLAENLARETVNRKLNRKDIGTEMQSATFDPQQSYDKLVKKDVGDKLGIKGKIEDGKIIQAARGIKKAQSIGGEKATKDLDMKDVVKAGEGKMSEKDLAKLILKKSGQDIEKYEPKKNKKEPEKLKYLKPTKPLKRGKDNEY